MFTSFEEGQSLLMVGGLFFGSKIALVLLMLMMGLSAFLGRSTPLVPKHQGTVWTQEDSSYPESTFWHQSRGRAETVEGPKSKRV